MNNLFPNISEQHPAIGWWSGGITSAIACKLLIDLFGKKNVRIVFIDTKSEDSDTYRFKTECENWYGVTIESITNSEYSNVEDVYRKHLTLNIANGAKCSEVLKIAVRKKFQTANDYSIQAFGFDSSESKRGIALKANHPETNPFFPLIALGLSKEDCIKMLPNDLFIQIKLPRTYRFGYLNNNCFEYGCVQGGIGYWQKIQRDDPEKFERRALLEHELTDLKGEPVTMLKDQSKNGGLLFLKPHPKYPDLKDISMMKGREPKPLFECNGFCGTNDLEKNPTELEINYEKGASNG